MTDFVLQQNCDWNRVITYEDANGSIDLTGYSAEMQVRATITDATVILTLTPTLGGSAGTISLNLTNEQLTQPTLNLKTIHTPPQTVTETLADGSVLVGTGPTAVYDLILTSASGVKKCLLAGNICFVPTVTRN